MLLLWLLKSYLLLLGDSGAEVLLVVRGCLSWGIVLFSDVRADHHARVFLSVLLSAVVLEEAPIVRFEPTGFAACWNHSS